MLTARLALALRVGLIVCAVTASCSSDPSASGPISVDPADASARSGILTVEVGAIVNTAAPTAERDERVVQVLTSAAANSVASAAVNIDIVRIDEIADVPSAVAELVERGVTVIMALCDDATVASIVEASIAAEVLAVTGCVTIPRPTFTIESPLFIDLAGLHDAGAAMVEWAAVQEMDRLATIRSNLVPDVAQTCVDVEAASAKLDIALTASGAFTELIDDPAEIVASIAPLIVDAEVLMVCALPPAAGDVVAALRAAGFEQPIVLPWFVDAQEWEADVSEVVVITPASRHGDDPVQGVQQLLTSIGDDAQSVDVITADTVAILAAAAELAGSVGSSRLAAAIRGSDTIVLSGELQVAGDPEGLVSRTYRSISITDGQPAFGELVTPLRTPR